MVYEQQTMRQLNVEWNKAVRRSLQNSIQYLTRLLPQFVNSFSVKNQHAWSVKNFLDAFNSFENIRVLCIGERVLRKTILAPGHNRARLQISSGVSKLANVDATSPIEGVSEVTNLLDNAMQIRELIARDEITELHGFTYRWVSARKT